MSLEPGLVLGRPALELDWSEKQRLLRALWQFGVIGLGLARAGIGQLPKAAKLIWRLSAYSRSGDESSG